MYGKSNMEAYITICKIDSQREFAVWLRKLIMCGVAFLFLCNFLVFLFCSILFVVVQLLSCV